MKSEQRGRQGEAKFVCTHGKGGMACGQCEDERDEHVRNTKLADVTLHQLFSAAALVGILANCGSDIDKQVRNADDLAEEANIIADSMCRKIAEGTEGLVISVYEIPQG